MKCPHCSAWADPASWFCPDCRRSFPRRPRRAGSGWQTGLFVALVLAGLWLVALRAQSRPPAPSDAAGWAETGSRAVPISFEQRSP